jgi:plastocyanin
MARRYLALTLVAALAATALAAGAIARRSAAPTIVGTVGPSFTITLKKNSKAVKTLKAGTYTLVIHDKASIHAWSLDGPHGFAKDFTKVPFVGTKTFTVKLKAGKYKYYCPSHEATMFGRFTVS